MAEEFATERVKVTKSLKEKIRRESTKNKKLPPKSHSQVIEEWYLASHSASLQKK
jgi:ppGpp synthetase/RelA/SpoT-type nucleotidyltranferase